MSTALEDYNGDGVQWCGAKHLVGSLVGLGQLRKLIVTPNPFTGTSKAGARPGV